MTIRGPRYELPQRGCTPRGAAWRASSFASREYRVGNTRPGCPPLEGLREATRWRRAPHTHRPNAQAALRASTPKPDAGPEWDLWFGHPRSSSIVNTLRDVSEVGRRRVFSRIPLPAMPVAEAVSIPVMS